MKEMGVVKRDGAVEGVGVVERDGAVEGVGQLNGWG